MNDRIEFPKASNLDNLANPLIKRLWEGIGDTASSIEVMMKFHRADVGAKQNLISKIPYVFRCLLYYPDIKTDNQWEW